MKRSSPLKRKAPLRATPPAKASVPLLRLRGCEVCKTKFRPFNSFTTWCSPECGAVVGQKRLQAKKDREHKAKLRATRETLPTLKSQAQEAFNRYVRFRDVGKGCFVCGTTLVMGGVGGGFDAGHIRARSQADHLRFDERNVHGQCKPCNAAGSTKDHEMRAAASRLLGQDEAEALYADNRVHKWKRDEVRVIRDTYRAKARELEKQREG